MARQLFYRNIRAREQLELFLVAAVSSLLLLRFYLHLAGYPQVGGGSLHIAHMLWGGLLMMSAIVINVAFLGARAERLAVLLGGIGFGIFIDELGKFITKDNNYFFRPTIGIIYALFLSLYLIFNFLSRKQRYTSRELQLNALSGFEEAIVHDMDPLEKSRVAAMLARANPASPYTKYLQELLAKVDTVPNEPPNRVRRFVNWADKVYRRFWRQRSSRVAVRVFFVVEAGIFLLAVIGSVYNNFDQVLDIFQGHESYGSQLLIGQVVSSGIAAAFAITGVVLLTKSRAEAFEQFRRATLVNLFLTEFFIFSRIQFGAMPGFLFNLALLGLITYALHQERRGHAQGIA